MIKPVSIPTRTPAYERNGVVYCLFLFTEAVLAITGKCHSRLWAGSAPLEPLVHLYPFRLQTFGCAAALSGKIFFQIALFCFLFLKAQTLTAQLRLDSSYVLARKQYPLIRQLGLIEQSARFSIENAARGAWPQWTINGQATYQNEVTRLPIAVPGMNVPVLGNDQYRIYTEINQPLTDALYTTAKQKQLARVNADLERQNAETELFKLRDRVNQLFFGILMLDAQLEQNRLVNNDLQAGIEKLSVSVNNGVALPSTLDLLRAEQLKNNQRLLELNSMREAYVAMLGTLTGRSLSSETMLEEPASPVLDASVRRPEMQAFELQRRLFDVQQELLLAKNLPRLSLFFQGGYGQPGLNMLNPEWDIFYVGGLRFQWNLSGQYTRSNERQLLRLNQQSVDVKQSVFLFNTRLQMQQHQTEMARLASVISSDQELIALRTGIKETAKNQLENGTITTNDFLSSVTAEDQARQQLAMHRIQLLLTQYTYQTLTGN
jgi:outer membrane protein TolC